MAAGLLAFGIALFASLMLTVPVRALAIRVGMVDLPGPRKVHLQPIPLLGGLAMWGAIMLAILLAFDGPARAQSLGIVSGATLVAAVGFPDERATTPGARRGFLGERRSPARGRAPRLLRSSLCTSDPAATQYGSRRDRSARAG